MRARFIGADASCGYRTGQVYELDVVPRIVRPTPVPYASWDAFDRNWQRISAAVAHEETRRALEQCWSALAFSYGGTSRDTFTEPEDLAAHDAMLAAGRALGKPHCGSPS